MPPRGSRRGGGGGTDSRNDPPTRGSWTRRAPRGLPRTSANANATGQQPQHRVYAPGKRHMELMPSVSRSSGLDKDGDALRDPTVQEEYRAFIEEKVNDYWKKYPLRSHHDVSREDADSQRHRQEMEGNLLILFRKLREGLLSTQRRDSFAREVYETSLHLSVLFKSPAQTTSTLSHLFPDLYVPKETPSPCASAPGSTASKSRPTPNVQLPATNSRATGSPSDIPPTALSTTLIALVHQLVQSYPSQLAFHDQLRQLHPSLQDILRAPALSDAPPSSRSSARSAAASSSNEGRRPGAGSLPSPRAASPGLSVPSPHATAARSQPSEVYPPSWLSLPPSRSHAHVQASLPSVGPRGAHATDCGESSGHASARDWILALARCVRTRNYARLDGLTHRGAYARFVGTCSARETQCSGAEVERTPGGHTDRGRGRGAGPDLALEALTTLIEGLLDKARETTWRVLRAAYRELSLRATLGETTGGGSGTTGEWLARSLVLGRGGDGEDEGGVEAWLETRRGLGEARRKEGEGIEGRWILAKA